MQTAKAKLNVFPLQDTISAMQNILARSQVMIPNLETPFHLFPNTDHSTIDLESQNVLDIIAERQQQLDAILHEVLSLEIVMDGIKNLHQQLIEKKDKITQSMNLHKGLVSPLWRFPSELLSQIFHYCLPDTGPKINCLSPPSRLKAPMLLVGICRRWREVATSTPSLWCRLHLEIDDTDWQRAASCYDSWLKWSRGLPLSLVVKCYKHNHSTVLQRLLHPYVNQISILSIFFFSDADKPEILLTDLPALEELTIFFNTRVTLASVSQLPSTISRFTAILPSFSQYRCNYLGSMWDQLTDVGIGSVFEPDSTLELLQLCPNLSSLTLRDSFYYQRHALEPFTHPKIQFLRIDHKSPAPEQYDEPLCDLLGALSLPNLRFLEFRNDHPCSTRQIHQVLGVLLERSKCPLESLKFSSQVEMTDEQRAGYTTLIPSLKTGIVEEGYFIPDLEKMSFPPGGITSFYCTH